MIITATMMEKRTALASLVKTVLDAAMTDGTTWIVETRPRDVLFKGQGTRLERDRIMGKPVRYVNIGHVGSTFAEEQFQGLDADMETPHQFAVGVYMEYKDNANAAKASQALWDAATESAGGLMPTLRSTRKLTTAGGVAGLDSPTEDIYTFYPMALGDDQFVHHLQFFITAT